ncbi:hypothetical protein MBENS4_0625 [Novosphingobium sp. MBES04]|nr:hypothetical protein MBENS4_0625 [Novosphingobium sp. MBES04]
MSYACKSPSPRPSFAPAALALTCALALSACAGTTERTTPASTLAPIPAAVHAPTEPYWWRSAGDPLLAELVETGLAQNRDLTCQALSLRRANERARSHARRIDTRIGRLFDTRGTDVDAAQEAARAFTYADRRADLAARIARSYIATRELQEMLEARHSALATTRDNAEIAAFREERASSRASTPGLPGPRWRPATMISARSRAATRTAAMRSRSWSASATRHWKPSSAKPDRCPTSARSRPKRAPLRTLPGAQTSSRSNAASSRT